MENLINGLLAYSRVGRGDQTIEEVDLNQLLREQIDLLDPPSAFTLDVQPDLPTLPTRRVPLMQVFTNLISNAIKHHHRSDGRIEFAAKPTTMASTSFQAPMMAPASTQPITVKFSIFFKS